MANLFLRSIQVSVIHNMNQVWSFLHLFSFTYFLLLLTAEELKLLNNRNVEEDYLTFEILAAKPGYSCSTIV